MDDNYTENSQRKSASKNNNVLVENVMSLFIITQEYKYVILRCNITYAFLGHGLDSYHYPGEFIIFTRVKIFVIENII